MPRVANQKEKLLVLLSVLQEKTDEDHPLSVPQLLAELQERGIQAERKSIYDDMETLRRQIGRAHV